MALDATEDGTIIAHAPAGMSRDEINRLLLKHREQVERLRRRRMADKPEAPAATAPEESPAPADETPAGPGIMRAEGTSEGTSGDTGALPWPCTVKYSARRRRVALDAAEDGTIIVHAPVWMTQADIDRLLLKHKDRVEDLRRRRMAVPGKAPAPEERPAPADVTPAGPEVARTEGEPADREVVPWAYTVEYSARRRRLAVHVAEDGAMTVHAPVGMDRDEIDSILLRERTWVENLRRRRMTVPDPTAEQGNPDLPWKYTVQRSDRRNRLALEVTPDGEMVVHAPTHMTRDEIAEILKRDSAWVERVRAKRTAVPARPRMSHEELETLKQHARASLPILVASLAPVVGVRVSRVSIRAQKTRWGSCTPDGHISLNALLILAPSEVCTYVVVHELCHLLVMNHSPAFWAEVARVLPDWRASLDWLKRNGCSLRAALPD